MTEDLMRADEWREILREGPHVIGRVGTDVPALGGNTPVSDLALGQARD
jgi:hypothetical protein